MIRMTLQASPSPAVREDNPSRLAAQRPSHACSRVLGPGSSFGPGPGLPPALSPARPTPPGSPPPRRRARAGGGARCFVSPGGGAGDGAGRGQLWVSLRHREVPIRPERGLRQSPVLRGSWRRALQFLLLSADRRLRPVRPARGLRPADPRCSGCIPELPGSAGGPSAEMPGRRARKSSQPSPTRVPAGRESWGPRRSWPGRGPGSRSRSGQGQPVAPGPKSRVGPAPWHVL